VALGEVASSGAGAVLLLNNDAAITEDHALDLLAALENNPRLGVVGPLLEERYGNHRTFSAGGRDMARYRHTRRVYPTADKARSAESRTYLKIVLRE
jgi:GT2 family glycosyltransferase